MITKKELMDALMKVPDGATLEKNDVGNLNVFLNEKKEKYLGFLDLFEATWNEWPYENGKTK